MTALDPADARIDDALKALGGEDSDFIVKGIPGPSASESYAVGLFCNLCPVPDSEIGRGVYSFGMIELWELITDARSHFDMVHGEGSS